MGMDLHLYEVRLASNNETSQEVTAYPLAPDQVELYKAKFGDLIYEEATVDIDQLLNKYGGLRSNASIVAWDLDREPGKKLFIDVSAECGVERVIFSEEQVREFEESAWWICLESFALYCKEHTYIRKPFRRNLNVDLSEIQGNTLILRSNNFAGADGDAVLKLMGETAVKFGMFFAGKEKLNVIKQLAALSNDPEYWQKNIIDRIENEENMYLAINW